MTEELEDSLSAEATESTEEKGGLPIVPIAIALVLLIAIGAVGWFVVMPMLSGSPEAEQETADEEMLGAEDADKEAVYNLDAKLGIIEFENPFTIKLRKNDGVLEAESFLLVGLTLEVASPEIQDTLTGDPIAMARIKDTILEFFRERYPQDLESPQTISLKQQLKDRINAQFPEKYHVTRIYFHDFLIQPGG